MKSKRCPSLPCLLVLTFSVFAGMLTPRAALAAAADEPKLSDANVVPSPTSRVVAAANAFLATLDEKLRAKVLFAFNDDQQRARWSNFPTGVVPRGGMSLREMSPAQRAAALNLVSAALSPQGFEKVQQIMEADDVFKATNHGPPPGGNDHPGGPGHPPSGPDQPGGQGGLPPDRGNAGDHGHPPFGNPGDGGHGRPPMGGDLFGKDLYYLSILGTPSEKSLGCCSMAVTTWPSTLRLSASAAC